MLGRRVGLGLAARGVLRDAVAYAQQAEQRGFASVWLHESYPVGFLVAAILHANEWRDITEDARLGSRTLSSVLGASGAHTLYLAPLVGAQLVVALAAMTRALPLPTLLTMLSLPVFVSVLHASELGATGQRRAIAMIDLKTARLHLLFGALLAVGLAVSALTAT